MPKCLPVRLDKMYFLPKRYYKTINCDCCTFIRNYNKLTLKCKNCWTMIIQDTSRFFTKINQKVSTINTSGKDNREDVELTFARKWFFWIRYLIGMSSTLWSTSPSSPCSGTSARSRVAFGGLELQLVAESIVICDQLMNELDMSCEWYKYELFCTLSHLQMS